MNANDLHVAANLASLNEIITEMVQASADGTLAEPEYAELVRDTLRQHSHSLGFKFQGESPPGAEGMQQVGWDYSGQPRQPYRGHTAPAGTGVSGVRPAGIRPPGSGDTPADAH